MPATQWIPSTVLDFSDSQSSKLYSSSRLLRSPGDGRRDVSGVVAVNIFLHSNYGQKNQGRTDGRPYRHFRTRNGVIFLNGNFWPPLKSFIICFRDLYKIFRNLTETGILPNYTQINGYPVWSVHNESTQNILTFFANSILPRIDFCWFSDLDDGKVQNIKTAGHNVWSFYFISSQFPTSSSQPGKIMNV